MRINKHIVIAICLSTITAYTLGVLTVRYRLFPYHQFVVLKDFVHPKSQSTHSDDFYHRKSFFEQHGGHHYDVVFIGDSITEKAEWQDLFPSLNIANRGIGGDSTRGVLDRMDSIYTTHAPKAFIMIGLNDLNEDSDDTDVTNTLTNYQKIIQSLTAHGMQTYVQSTLVTSKENSIRNRKIIALNAQLKQLANESHRFTYIDLNAGLAKNALLDHQYSRDGVHLNGEGYAVWKNAIKNYIQTTSNNEAITKSALPN